MKLNSIFIYVLVVAMVISCQKSPKQLLTNTWVLDNIDYSEALRETPADNKEFIKKNLEQLTKMKGNIILDFKADGKIVTTTPDFISKNGGVKSQEGTWFVSEDGKKVTVINTDSKQDTTIITINTLTSDEFSYENQKMIMKFVPKKIIQ